jgi:hypothetical protein
MRNFDAGAAHWSSSKTRFFNNIEGSFSKARTVLFQVGSQDVNQFLGGPGLYRSGILIRVHHMEPYKPVEHFRHQRVDRPTARGNCLENL